MITLRRNTERQHEARGKHAAWRTFFSSESPDSLAASFGALTLLDELRLPPAGALAPRYGAEEEIVTYVFRGALAQEDSTGRSGVVHAGEFQRLVVGSGVRYQETNASRHDWAHIFRIALRPAQVGLAAAREQQRFAAAQCRNVLCVVASPDGRNGSLRVWQDALVYSSVLDPGHHLIHEIRPERSVWLHVVSGEAVLQDILLTAGDGVGVAVEPAVSFRAQQHTEVLLVDLGPQSRSFTSGATP